LPGTEHPTGHRDGPLDPATYVAVSVTLIAAAVVASYLPSRRAMRLEPTMALRDE
jgi:ABC-type lipoprotein release transport system permease subunit